MRKLHGEDCWAGLEIGQKTQNLKARDPELHKNLKPKLRYNWNLNGFERSRIWYLDPKLRTEIPQTQLHQGVCPPKILNSGFSLPLPH